MLDSGLPTPPPIEPMKKTQLAAAKRLEKELRLAKFSKGKEEAAKSKKKALKVEAKTKGPQRVQNQKAEKKDLSGGPMISAMKRFVDQRKAEGTSHHDAQRLWKNSEERRSIVEQMSESERKRRRYWSCSNIGA